MQITKDNYKTFIGKVVEFLPENQIHNADWCGIDTGGKARIADIIYENCYSYFLFNVFFDFSEFKEYNQNYYAGDYYDSKGVACLKWNETKNFPKDYKFSVYYDPEYICKCLKFIDFDKEQFKAELDAAKNWCRVNCHRLVLVELEKIKI